MKNKSETREERLGRLRAWAHGPYRTVEVNAPQEILLTASTGQGITHIPARGLDSAIQFPGQPGTPTTFHTACDAPAGTTVTFGGGPFLNQPVVLCVFWGAIWNTPITPGVGAIYAALTSLSTPVTNQYGSYSYFDGLGTGWGFDLAGPPLVVTSSTVNIPPSFQPSDIESAARAIVHTLGPHQSWDLLVIFMPPGFNTANGASGAHSYYWDAGDPSVEYAWVDYSATLANITFTFSHEIVEAMTDPHGDAMQINPSNPTNWNEICDVCCSSGVYNGVVVSSYFSDTLGACMLPSPPVPVLVPDDYQIDSVRKVTERGGGHRQFIQMVSGPGNGNGRWVLAEADVANIITSGQGTFYTLVDGRRANVIVETWYLKTVADNFTPNNLDSLPEF
ncbi:DUF3892 domain-containing protein [Methylomonas sp. AM2-LC]|uniref:DUF3892 domain-containing protein n=1 Tax=Methylomonas sp. AM2-LC TaxID=3153301 RepID=UPI0032631B0F